MGGSEGATAVGKSAKYRVNWFHTLLLTATPALALYGFLTTELRWQTLVLAVAMYFATGIGITAGYHRMWSHRAFKGRLPVRIWLALFGAAAFEGSILWWSRKHRAHHRYNDTNKDPYNVRKGFWWAHIGWMLIEPVESKEVRVERANASRQQVKDLAEDPIVMWQHRHYVEIALLIGIALPTLLAGMLWGDYRGGYFYGVLARMVFVHHATFFVNSLAHTVGERTYSETESAYDSWITAVLTLGEGYHNFHHNVSSDYRNAVKWYQYDPTKWVIRAWWLLGLAYDLRITSDEEILKSTTTAQLHKAAIQQHALNHGRNHDSGLKPMTWADVRQEVAEGSQLVVINGIVHDVENFVDRHPGGRLTLLEYVGKDMTSLFYYANASEKAKAKDAEKVWPYHLHSKEALGFLPATRVGRLVTN